MVVPDRLLVDLGGDGQAAVLSWPDGGLPEEVSRAPLAWPLDADALEDLRWYLEDYLLAPFGVWEDRGPAVQGKLAGWGDQVFGSVFGAGPARDAYQRARDRGLEVVFRSAEPGLLGLPWELMRDGAGPVALGAGGISRSLPVAGGAGTLEVPGGRLRVLMVISRPAGTAGCGVSDGGPAAAGAAGRGPRRGRPDRAAPADLRRAAPGAARQAADAVSRFTWCISTGTG